mmetsp:Transcript_34995/g.59425  ORF Transcript_34995/g.59425 Transcript_34995/m.59425 type:complete len:213 (-) Transcript_34995:140-778(-)
MTSSSSSSSSSSKICLFIKLLLFSSLLAVLGIALNLNNVREKILLQTTLHKIFHSESFSFLRRNDNDKPLDLVAAVDSYSGLRGASYSQTRAGSDESSSIDIVSKDESQEEQAQDMNDEGNKGEDEPDRSKDTDDGTKGKKSEEEDSNDELKSENEVKKDEAEDTKSNDSKVVGAEETTITPKNEIADEGSKKKHPVAVSMEDGATKISRRI